MNDVQWVDDSLTLGGEEISVRNGSLKIEDLKFYPDNPRIYSLIQRENTVPSQDEILRRLNGMDHVKQLIQSIRANGGLTDPLLVRDGDLVVLEGNSRLAAYHVLARNDPIKWGIVKVRLLPSDISEKLVFALLGEYHIIGRKDWAPYEQAGYLFRRATMHGVKPRDMANEMGLSLQKVNRLIEIYKFMVEHNENDVNRWSYYDEYWKLRVVKKARAEDPELDAVVVDKIKRREIKNAIDVRNMLLPIIKAGAQSVKILKSGNNTFERAYESARSRGVHNMWLSRFKKFRRELQEDSLIADFEEMSPEQQQKCLFELKKIESQMRRIQRKIG